MTLNPQFFVIVLFCISYTNQLPDVHQILVVFCWATHSKRVSYFAYFWIIEYNTIWSFMIFRNRTSASSASIWVYIHLHQKCGELCDHLIELRIFRFKYLSINGILGWFFFLAVFKFNFIFLIEEIAHLFCMLFPWSLAEWESLNCLKCFNIVISLTLSNVF